MEKEGYEKLYGKLQKTTSGSFFTTLRKNVVDINEWKEGDILEIYVKRRA